MSEEASEAVSMVCESTAVNDLDTYFIIYNNQFVGRLDVTYNIKILTSN